LFDYPYSNQKNNLNTYAPKLGVEEINNDSVYLKRSIVCLEDHFMKQMVLTEQLHEEYGPLLGDKDDEDDNLYPCDHPTIKFKVRKFNRKQNNEVYDEDY